MSDGYGRAAALVLAFLGCVFAANATLDAFGFWQLGWLLIPSGSLWAGLTFTLRDGIHETVGRLWVLVAIVVGAALSAVLDPFLALASGTAFLLGETADLCVYEPLRQRNRLWAVRLSGFVGSIVDSAVFLWLAPFPFSWAALAGVIVAKAVMVELSVWLLAAWKLRTA
jgi:uncharacterized PurR-regulated membrane protein YhhQ (DUF165 family)